MTDRKAKNHEYYIKNRDRIRKYQHQYYLDNKVDIKDKKAAYYQNMKAKADAYAALAAENAALKKMLSDADEAAEPIA